MNVPIRSLSIALVVFEAIASITATMLGSLPAIRLFISIGLLSLIKTTLEVGKFVAPILFKSSRIAFSLSYCRAISVGSAL